LRELGVQFVFTQRLHTPGVPTAERGDRNFPLEPAISFKVMAVDKDAR
jgi:hypothetical protein